MNTEPTEWLNVKMILQHEICTSVAEYVHFNVIHKADYGSGVLHKDLDPTRQLKKYFFYSLDL